MSNLEKEVYIDDEELITEIQYNGKVIWDPKEEGHSVANAFTSALDVIIINLKLEPRDKQIRTKVLARWTKLKNRFAKEFRKKRELTSGSTSGSFKSKFKYYEQLKFLEQTL